MLTDDQQSVVEQAVAIVPKVISAFRLRYPTLRKQLDAIDSSSVAYLALCRAARTYNPEKSRITTYFSVAVRNALLREIDRNRAMRYGSAARIPMELAEHLAASKSQSSGKLHCAIARLPPKSRRLIQLRFYKGQSLREIGEQVGCDQRTIRRRLEIALSVLRTILESDVQPL
jgi:RNA polymerase sigma factor (sigma-70 family)